MSSWFHGNAEAKVSANERIADSPEEALYDNAHKVEKPFKAIAAEIGLTRERLYKLVTEEASRFPARLIAPLTRVTGRFDYIRRICHDCGCICVPMNPSASFNARTAEVLQETADYLHSVAIAEMDGRVTADEARATRKQADEAIAALEAHARWMESRVDEGRTPCREVRDIR